MKKIIAFASDDGLCLKEGHFGDARVYNIYCVSDDKIEFKKKVKNEDIVKEFDEHTKKGKMIVEGLAKYDVDLIVSCQFGPNIKFVRKHFVPVKCEKADIYQTLDLLKDFIRENEESLSENIILKIEEGKVKLISL